MQTRLFPSEPASVTTNHAARLRHSVHTDLMQKARHSHAEDSEQDSRTWTDAPQTPRTDLVIVAHHGTRPSHLNAEVPKILMFSGEINKQRIRGKEGN